MFLSENLLNPYRGQEPAELREFLHRVIDERGAVLMRPPSSPVHHYGTATLTTLYREDRYQVELICADTGLDVPMHSHPDVDSYEVSLSDDLVLFVEDTQVSYPRVPRRDGTVRSKGKYLYVPAGVSHGGWWGESGTMFLSVQLWPIGVTPTTIVHNWDDRGRS